MNKSSKFRFVRKEAFSLRQESALAGVSTGHSSIGYPFEINPSVLPFGLCNQIGPPKPQLMVAFHEYVILPALHPQQDLTQQGQVVPMIGVNGDAGG